MKLAAITGKRQVTLIDGDMPSLQEGWALVKIVAAPMCTEYKQFLHGQPNRCLGHEATGEVVQTAPGSRVSVGDRVVVMPQYACGRCSLCLAGDYIYCEHGLDCKAPTMAQFIAKPSWLLPVIPEDISYVQASLACCALGPSHGALSALGVDAFSTVLVAGLGPVGLGAVVNARYRGSKVIAVEMNRQRAELARQMGVEAVFDPSAPEAVAQIKALTGGRGPDFGIDCSGKVSAHRLLIDAVRRKGAVAFVGECNEETPLQMSRDLLRKGLRLQGSWHYNLNEFAQVIEVIRHSPLIERLVTHVFPMSRIQQAFETAAGGASGKIILQPWE